MVISVNPSTYVISIPQAELTFIGGSVYQLDTNVFRIALKDWEDNEEGIYHPRTHTHNTTVLLGGIQYARVLEILSPYTITFQETGTPYSVTLIGSNNNILEKTNLGTVQILSNNSAGLVNVSEVQYGAFQGVVTIDVDDGVAGTTYPTGTPIQPVNNLVDAQTIAVARGFKTFFVKSNLTISAGDFSDSFVFEGESQTRTIITIDAGANVTNCEFKNCSILGTLDGGNILDDCILSTLSYANGIIKNCLLNAGTITLGGGAVAHFLNCFSGVPGVSTPTINMGGSGQTLGIRNYNGGIKITNHSGTDPISIDMNSGQVIIDSTITAGTIVVRGIAKLVDNSTGTAVVNSSDLLVPNRLTNLQYLVETRRDNHIGTGNIWYWDPVNGLDTNEGRAPETAFQTFSAANSAVVDNNHDVIIAIASDPSGTTVITSPVVITKNWVSLRGPGINFKIQPTTASANGALVDCDGMTGVSLQGFVVDGSSAVGTGILLNTAEASVENILIRNITGAGLYTEHCFTTTVRNVSIHDCTVAGIQIHECKGMKLNNVELHSTVIGFDTTAMTPGGGGDTELKNVSFINLTTGINIGANVRDTKIYESCAFSPSVVTRLVDNGTDTMYLTATNNTSVADAVWDELVANHLTAGTTGKALNDAGSAGNPWGTSVTGNTDPGTFGELVGKKLLTVAKFLGLK